MKSIDLCGIWRCRGATDDRGCRYEWPGGSEFLPDYDYRVPGTIQEAMEFLTGDVHLSHNVLSARFIEEQFWLCKTSFFLSENDLAGEKRGNDRVRLVFERLDLCAVIYLNGKEVGRHANFYLPCRIDITDAVKAGENTLAVVLESGIFSAAEKESGKLIATDTGRLFKRAYLRKPQSSFEWDWAPRLLNVGITGPCRVEIAPFFPDETAVFHSLNGDDSEAEITVRQFLSLPEGAKARVSVTVAETGAQTAAEICGAASAGSGGGGESCAELKLTVRDPVLWQPRGRGIPFLYTLTVTVSDTKTGETVKSFRKKIGLRRVEIDQSPRKAGGRYFRLMINGERFFAKGGNFVPGDILFSRLDRKTYETLISRALEDNFNALRVWGGGTYESEDFYDLCDENGIVVWQDLIGACATYPSFDPEFLENYKKEITYQVRRLSSHPSLVIYAGNNEINQFVDAYGAQYFSDASLYYYTIPAILHAEGDGHYYQPSSPYSPDGFPATDFSVGDQHPWQIGFSNRDYFGYREMDCRFPNEGGILGPTSLPNMRAALGDGHEYMYSFDFKLHDNSVADGKNNSPELLLKEKLGMTVGKEGLLLADYVYYGGFLQGEGLSEYILNFRRRMNDTTGSAIFWMFNDCWPATRSWTTVDYLRNRTPSFWAVRRSFAPIAADIVKSPKKGCFDVYTISDLTFPEGKRALLRFGWAFADGSGLHAETREITLPSNDSAVSAVLENVPEGAIPFAELYLDGDAPDAPTARRRFVEKPYNELGLIPPVIRVTVRGDEAIFESDSFVFGVCLDLDGEDGGPSDNFFDLFPRRPYRVKLGKRGGTILYSYPEERKN